MSHKSLGDLENTISYKLPKDCPWHVACRNIDSAAQSLFGLFIRRKRDCQKPVLTGRATRPRSQEGKSSRVHRLKANVEAAHFC